jgi:hypothetical protein
MMEIKKAFEQEGGDIKSFIYHRDEPNCRKTINRGTKNVVYKIRFLFRIDFSQATDRCASQLVQFEQEDHNAQWKSSAVGVHGTRQKV